MSTGRPRGEAHDKLVRDIILALSKTGLCRVWEQPTGAAYRNDQLIRYGLVGCADITGIIRGGIRLEVEVKTGKGVQTKGQIAFSKMIEDFGGIYAVARDVVSVVDLVKSAASGMITV